MCFLQNSIHHIGTHGLHYGTFIAWGRIPVCIALVCFLKIGLIKLCLSSWSKVVQTKIFLCPGEAQGELPEEVLQSKEESGPRAPTHKAVRPTDFGGTDTHIHTESHIHTHMYAHIHIYIHTLCDYLCVYIQGLKLLHDAGIFFGHLHTSNVLVDDGVCRLMDVENGMLGVPSALRPAFTQFRKINVCAHTDSVWISLISWG